MSEINSITTTNTTAVSTKHNDSGREKVEGAKPQVNTNVNVGGDKVSLTNSATQLESLRQTIIDSPMVDKDKVSAIKAAIADGSYKVDVEALAQNMISFESKIS